VVCFVKDDPVPLDLVQQTLGIQVFCTYSNGGIAGNDNGCLFQVFQSDDFFCRAIKHKRFMTGGAEDFVHPLLDEHVG